MIGKYKKFDKDLFEKNDPTCRQIVKKFLLKNNIVVDDNPNKYGVDLLSEDESVQIEIEHRLSWVKDEFPYSEINVPERKAKFFSSGKVSYVIVSKNYSHIGVITGEKIKKYINLDNLKESSNKFISSGEMFYKIPKTDFKWVKIDS